MIGEKIYINYYLNITENTTITVVPKTRGTDDEISDESSDIYSDNNTFIRNNYKEKSNKGISNGIAILIIILLSLLLLSVLAITIIMKRKNTITNIENKQNTENNIFVR